MSRFFRGEMEISHFFNIMGTLIPKIQTVSEFIREEKYGKHIENSYFSYLRA
jgi:hypothetical protein